MNPSPARQRVIKSKVVMGGEALWGVWRWIKVHKAATALIVVLLTLVPVLPEYKIVDFAGRDEEEIGKLLCSNLPAGECHRNPCFSAIEEQMQPRRPLSEKLPLIPWLFDGRKKSPLFDYAEWKRDYSRHYVVYRAIASETEKLYPVSGTRSTPCPAEPDWNRILKHVPLDELQRLTQQHWDEIERLNQQSLDEIQ